jgi:hypothetical protein
LVAEPAPPDIPLKNLPMTADTDSYDNPLLARYAGRAMAERWGPARKARLWRRLWLALA